MRSTRLFAVLVSLALVVVGCAGASEPAEPVALAMEMAHYAYTPDDIAVPTGAEITITATNGDNSGRHDLVIVRDTFTKIEDAKRAMRSDPEIVVAELDAVKAGKSDSLVVTFDEPGVYQILCTIPGHFDNGMRGTVTVEG
ncbi:MAG: plastocyanin/azurin family copper-binding protein [Actinomycetota bacterium]